MLNSSCFFILLEGKRNDTGSEEKINHERRKTEEKINHERHETHEKKKEKKSTLDDMECVKE